MNRQRITWLVIGLIFVAMLVARATTGQGIGRVYVKREQIALAQVALAGAAATSAQAVQPLPVGAGVKSEISNSANNAFIPADNQAWESVPLAKATRAWVEWNQVPPKEYFVAQATDPTQTQIVLSWPRTIGLWLAAFFTLAIFSFLYADNIFYKFAEATVIGVSAGYWMVIGFWDTLIPKLFGALTPEYVMQLVQPTLQPTPMSQKISMWFALILGVMMLWRLAPRGGWIAAWPLAFIVGVTAGLKIVSHVECDLMAQTVASMKPVVQLVPAVAGGTDWYASIWATLANALVLVGVICTLVYFLFSVQHKGVVGATARVGVWYLMITFGAAFGFTVMGRIALLAARFEFLFDDWLWLIDPNHLRS